MLSLLDYVIFACWKEKWDSPIIYKLMILMKDIMQPWNETSKSTDFHYKPWSLRGPSEQLHQNLRSPSDNWGVFQVSWSNNATWDEQYWPFISCYTWTWLYSRNGQEMDDLLLMAWKKRSNTKTLSSPSVTGESSRSVCPRFW